MSLFPLYQILLLLAAGDAERISIRMCSSLMGVIGASLLLFFVLLADRPF